MTDMVNFNGAFWTAKVPEAAILSQPFHSKQFDCVGFLAFLIPDIDNPHLSQHDSPAHFQLAR